MEVKNNISKQTIILIDMKSKSLKVEMDLNKQTMLFIAENNLKKINTPKQFNNLEEALNYYSDTSKELEEIKNNFDTYRACIIESYHYRSKVDLVLEYDLKKSRFQFLVSTLDVPDSYYDSFENAEKRFQKEVLKHSQKCDIFKKIYTKGYPKIKI